AAELRQWAEPLTVGALEQRLDRDIERGVTSLGPHLDDIVLAAGTRELRSFGSQGEQRLAMLALLLAEAELITARRGVPPLLLLDDVLSELDPDRRRILAARVAASGQALVTATDAGMLPGDPGQLLEVMPGEGHDRTAGGRPETRGAAPRSERRHGRCPCSVGSRGRPRDRPQRLACALPAR